MRQLTGRDMAIRYCLNYVAAIQAKRLGLDALAEKFKERVSSGRNQGNLAPWLRDSELYDSIKTVNGEGDGSSKRKRGFLPESGVEENQTLVLRTYEIGDLLFEPPLPLKLLDELGDGRMADGPTGLRLSRARNARRRRNDRQRL